MPYIQLYLQLKVMASSIISFFRCLFPSSRPQPPPQPTHLWSDTHGVGSPSASTATSMSSTNTRTTCISTASAGTSNGGSSYSSPGTTPPLALANQQQVRDQRAQFLDKLSKGPARGRWTRRNKASHDGPNMQAPPPS